MSFTVIIPARYQSVRLPGKPLLDIAGKPMLQHVVERALQSDAKAVYVATDDERIEQACNNFGAKVCMTSSDHPCGTDRIEEVVTQLNLADDEIVINVQGDEPLLPPEVINQLAKNMQDNTSAGIGTLYEPIKTIDEVNNPNAVKVVSDNHNRALYFSRAAVPYPRDGINTVNQQDYKRHIGIYAYRVKVLHDFVSWPVSVLEKIEKLEQLRALSNGVNIHLSQACAEIPAGVDTEEDLQQVRKILAGSQ